MALSRTIEVSEVFSSLQGEGPTLGLPCVFLRLAGCNLRCCWCDTRYTWDFARYDRALEVHRRTVEDVAALLEQSGRSHLVITGGEPLLQQSGLAELLARLPATWWVEVETNGTVEPSRALLDRVSQWNVSPKLASSAEPLERRIHTGALNCLRDAGAWLKFVVDTGTDLVELDELVVRLAWPRERVLLMPQAASLVELREKTRWLGSAAPSPRYAIGPRLHVELWGGERGR